MINSRDFKNRRIRYRYKVPIDIRESDKFSGAIPANLYSVCGSSEEFGNRIEDEKCNCVSPKNNLPIDLLFHVRYHSTFRTNLYIDA